MAAANPAREALLEAVARGRQVPSTLQVRPGKASAGGPPSVFDGLHVEELQLCSEVPPPGSGAASTNGSSSSSSSASQAWVPVRVVKAPQPHVTPLPAVVLLHATGLGKDSLAARQAQFARRGYLAVAMDCRYHGDRAQGGDGCRDAYQEALVRAWRGSGERPFLLDNVWDLLRLLDWLGQRPDVNAARIGMTGVSLGGMHTWLAAAADERVAVAAPMIGVQFFGWAVQNDAFHGRVNSIPLVFQAAAADLAAQAAEQAAEQVVEAAEQAAQQVAKAAGQQQAAAGQAAAAAAAAAVTAEVVRAVWARLLPGLLERYDGPASLALIAPRPLLVATGELDPRCPLEGLRLALEPVRVAYQEQGAADKLQLYVVPGCEHHCTDCMWDQVSAFMDRHLLLSAAAPGSHSEQPEAAGAAA